MLSQKAGAAQMVENMLVVSEQVIILFLLAVLGYFCQRWNLLSNETTDGLAKLSLYVVAPCLMISSFQREFDPLLFHNFMLAAGLMLAVLVGTILLTRITISDPDERRKKVLRATAIFPNCGMISLALEYALYGADGVFYGVACVAAFNLVFWTYGILLLGTKKDWKLSTTLLNPGIVGTVVGLVLFATSFSLPSVVTGVCDHIANMNTPICMLVIGQRMYGCKIKALLTDRPALWSMFQRLLMVPLLTVLLLWIFRLDTMVAVVCVIAASAPAAAANTMLAIQLKQDSVLSAQIVSVETLFSMFTMSLMVALAKTIL